MFNPEAVSRELILDITLRAFRATIPQVEGSPPPPRYGHAFSCIGQRLIIYGGIDSQGKYVEARSFGPYRPSISKRSASNYFRGNHKKVVNSFPACSIICEVVTLVHVHYSANRMS